MLSCVASPSAAGTLKMSALPSSRITGPGSSTTSSALVLTEKPASGKVPRLSPPPKAHAPTWGAHFVGSVTEKASGLLYQPYQSPFVAEGDMFIANSASIP